MRAEPGHPMKTTIPGDAPGRRCPRVRTPLAGCSSRAGRAARLAPAPPVRSRGSRVAAPPDGALRSFRGDQRGTATIGAAIAISILVAAFAALMGIVHEIYVEDRMERGARAAVRAVSLAATAPASEKALKDIACKAVERELGEDEGEACACWTVEVEAFETPQALSGGQPRGAGAPHGGENADMVLVRVRRPYWDFLSTPVRADSGSADSGSEADGSEAAGSESDAGSCPDTSKAAEIVVAAVARNEREVRVPQ